MTCQRQTCRCGDSGRAWDFGETDNGISVEWCVYGAVYGLDQGNASAGFNKERFGGLSVRRVDSCNAADHAAAMDWRPSITFEPGKRSGKPCIRGLRITAYDVLEYLAAGMTPDEIVDDFPELTLDDIRAVLAFAD